MQILEGFRVVEWAAIMQGPSAAVKLGEMGAEVIKLEEPGTGDFSRGHSRAQGVPTRLPSGHNWFFEFLNYGKKSVAIDVKSERGKEAVYRLIEKSDIFLTTFRQMAAVRAGLDYESLSRVNPKLIYASGSCLGNKGPMGQSAGVEPVAQAKSGLMSITGEADAPPQRIGTGLCDQTGSIMLVLGVLAAVIARERYGIGQQVTSSQLGGAMLLQLVNVMGRVLSGQELLRDSRSSPRNPLSNHYVCQDGRWIALGMYADWYWPPFCRAIGHPELIEDARFGTAESRTANSTEVARKLDDVFASRPFPEWEKRLLKADIPFSVVNSIPDLLEDPQVMANDYLPVVEHPGLGKTRWMLTPIELSKTPIAFQGPAPELGQHTEEVLTGVCGYTWEDVAQLREEGVI